MHDDGNEFKTPSARRAKITVLFTLKRYPIFDLFDNCNYWDSSKSSKSSTAPAGCQEICSELSWCAVPAESILYIPLSSMEHRPSAVPELSTFLAQCRNIQTRKRKIRNAKRQRLQRRQRKIQVFAALWTKHCFLCFDMLSPRPGLLG